MQTNKQKYVAINIGKVRRKCICQSHRSQY